MSGIPTIGIPVASKK